MKSKPTKSFFETHSISTSFFSEPRKNLESFNFSRLVNEKNWHQAWEMVYARLRRGLSIDIFKETDRALLEDYILTSIMDYATDAAKYNSLKYHFNCVVACISIKHLNDTQDNRFILNKYCRMMMDAFLTLPPSREIYNETCALLEIIDDNPCNQKDPGLAGTIVRVKTYTF